MKEQVFKDVMDSFGREKINAYPRIKEQVLESMETYANKRVIEELESIANEAKPLRYSDKHDVLLNRTKELRWTKET